MSKAFMGATVQYCGHDGYFLADIHEVGNTNVINAASGRVDIDKLTRPAKGATHILVDFPQAGFWKPYKGIFVVPSNQVREIVNE